MPKTDEENLSECQREIRCLRSAVREYEDRYSGVEIRKVIAKPNTAGRPFGEVANEMWSKAMELKANELSFDFSNHTVTIRCWE